MFRAKKNNRLNKINGFTLVELLAVILILIVLVLIAIPIVGKIIDEASKAAFVQSTKGTSTAM